MWECIQHWRTLEVIISNLVKYLWIIFFNCKMLQYGQCGWWSLWWPKWICSKCMYQQPSRRLGVTIHWNSLCLIYLGHAFCGAHGEVIKDLGYPTELRSFLKSCSSNDTPVDPSKYDKTMKSRVEAVLRDISKKAVKPQGTIKSATDVQGLFYDILFIIFQYQSKQRIIEPKNRSYTCRLTNGALVLHSLLSKLL